MSVSFERRGNHVILDFVNSRGNRLIEAEDERLTGYDDLLQFCKEFGLLTQFEAREIGKNPKTAKQAAFRSAVSLREQLFKILSVLCQASDFSPMHQTAIEQVGLALQAAEGNRHLAWEKEDLVWRWNTPTSASRPFEEIALLTKAFLCRFDRLRLKKCEMNDCGVLFIDNSPKKNRRWCSMAECGNRAKISRYRQRHR